MAQRTLVSIEQEIIKLQTVIDKLNIEKVAISTLLADAQSQRPAGIPPTWLPLYDERNNRAVVTAWFDPSKYGSDLVAFFR